MFTPCISFSVPSLGRATQAASHHGRIVSDTVNYGPELCRCAELGLGSYGLSQMIGGSERERERERGGGGAGRQSDRQTDRHRQTNQRSDGRGGSDGGPSLFRFGTTRD